MVEKEVPVPNNWYVNSALGGAFLDESIEVEVAAKTLHKMPTNVSLLLAQTVQGDELLDASYFLGAFLNQLG